MRVFPKSSSCTSPPAPAQDSTNCPISHEPGLTQALGQKPRPRTISAVAPTAPRPPVRRCRRALLGRGAPARASVRVCLRLCPWSAPGACACGSYPRAPGDRGSLRVTVLSRTSLRRWQVSRWPPALVPRVKGPPAGLLCSAGLRCWRSCRAPCSVHLNPLASVLPAVLPSCWHPCGVVRWCPRPLRTV